MSLFKKAEETKSGLKVLAYGATASGKTTFALTFPEIVAIDTEDGMAFYKNNPNLKLNKLVIQHVKFEEAEEKNKYGYPIHLLKDGKPIIKEIEYIELPYLRKEIQSIINEKLW